MISTTVDGLVNEKIRREDVFDCVVYIVRDADLVLYVGKSEANVVDRLLSHIGEGDFGWTGTSSLGRLIKANMPESGDWQIELLTPEECLSIIEQSFAYRRGTSPDGSACVIVGETTLSDGSTFVDKIRINDVVGLESMLIVLYKPCLNVIGNQIPTPLPERYWRH